MNNPKIILYSRNNCYCIFLYKQYLYNFKINYFEPQKFVDLFKLNFYIINCRNY